GRAPAAGRADRAGPGGGPPPPLIPPHGGPRGAPDRSGGTRCALPRRVRPAPGGRTRPPTRDQEASDEHERAPHPVPGRGRARRRPRHPPVPAAPHTVAGGG